MVHETPAAAQLFKLGRGHTIHACRQKENSQCPGRSCLRHVLYLLSPLTAAHKNRNLSSCHVQQLFPDYAVDPRRADILFQEPAAFLHSLSHNDIRILLKQPAEQIPDGYSLLIHIQKPGIIRSGSGRYLLTELVREDIFDPLSAVKPESASARIHERFSLLEKIKDSIYSKRSHFFLHSMPEHIRVTSRIVFHGSHDRNREYCAMKNKKSPRNICLGRTPGASGLDFRKSRHMTAQA